MSTISKLRIPFVVLTVVFLGSGCKKHDQVIICFRAPHFPVYIKSNNVAVIEDLRMHIVDKNSGDTSQTIYLKNKFSLAKLEDGQMMYEYKVNENEAFFNDVSSASQQYFIFSNSSGQADTIANYTWTTTKPKTGCYVFTNLSVTLNGKQYNPASTNVVLLE